MASDTRDLRYPWLHSSYL